MYIYVKIEKIEKLISLNSIVTFYSVDLWVVLISSFGTSALRRQKKKSPVLPLDSILGVINAIGLHSSSHLLRRAPAESDKPA